MSSKTEVNQNNVLLLAEANNKLAVMLHKKLAENGKNLFFSPLSLSMAMAMLFRGTKEETADELRNFLGFTGIDLSDEHIHRSFGDLLSDLGKKETSYTLAISNALISDKDFALIPEFKSDLEKIYQALTLEVDFAKNSATAVKTINKWVNKNTRNMIPKVVDSLNPATVMVLLNAVYFKGTWMKQFDPFKTQTGTFYNKGKQNQRKDVKFMNMTKKFEFTENEEYKAISLPYEGNDMVMILVLPDEKAGLANLERKIDSNFIKDLYKKMDEEKVDLSMPKLHVEYSNELSKVFQNLGLKRIFQGDGNFLGLSESRGIQVSDVIHKAVLDVNEEGSEAAAVTAVMEKQCAMIWEHKKVFLADHPFLFAIYHINYDMVLFMGRIEEM